jgi:hexosaminidase
MDGKWGEGRKRSLILSFAVLCLSVVAGCSRRNASEVIPAPVQAETSKGHFTLSSATTMEAAGEAGKVAELFQEAVSGSKGLTFKKADSASANHASRIDFVVQPSSNAIAESYVLEVTPNRVLVQGGDQAGLFYGMQTLLQLLPTSALSLERSRAPHWRIPAVKISDQPRFRWRGMMLDVARHFFTTAEIKRYLHALAFYKINVFHWHLTDDQGWRLEIKKYPRLTEAGAWRRGIGFGLKPTSATAYDQHGRYGGFYTQEEVREIVAYAADRHITVVPEIEMPGHACAALVAYPELSCTGGPFKTEMPAGVFNGVFCVGNDKSFEFLQEVLTEVFELFPGKFVHLGGDEVPTNNWHNCAKCQAVLKREGLTNDLELESYLLRRMARFASEHGRTPVGWSEVVHAGLPENVVVMDWIGGTAEAVKAGHEVVRTPVEYCYFDHYQSEDREHEPRASGALLTLQQVYAFEPVPEGISNKSILGPQANLWTEYIPNFKQVEYMTFPRICALAEVAWSPRGTLDWDGFSKRIKTHYQRFDARQINYRPPKAE